MSEVMTGAPHETRETGELWAEVKAIRNDEPRRAVQLLEVLCARHPTEYRYWWCMAELRVQQLYDINEATPYLRRAREIGPKDEAQETALRRMELRHAVFVEEWAGRLDEAIATYHAGVRTSAHAFKDIEGWGPKINGFGERLFQAAAPTISEQARQIAADVHANGITFRHWDDLIGDADLLARMQEVVRTTKDWTVPGKPHFFKAAIEEEQTLDDPMIRTGLHPALLDAANAFYGLFSRLVSANIVQTRIDTSEDRSRRGSEGWHRDPEDRPMFKAFIYLNDVLEPGHGPFQYVPDSRPGGRYEYLMPRFGRGVYDMTYKTRPDPEKAEAEIDPADVVTAFGRAGTIFFCDTSGFHRGGYCTTQDRHMVPCVYQRPASQYPSKLRLEPGPGASEAVRRATIRY
jgi:hypothetical protein